MERHSHQVTNTLIELDGNRATSESYVTVALWTLPDGDGSQSELVGRGRYLDRSSKRQGVWAIEHRTHLLDLSGTLPLLRGDVSTGSARDEGDLSFEFIPPGP
jgi:SnoaL-like domain